MAMSTSTVMAGRVSRELKQKLEQYKGDLDHSVALRWFSHLFSVSFPSFYLVQFKPMPV